LGSVFSCTHATLLAGVSEELLISRCKLLLQLLELQRQVHLRLALEREQLSGQLQILLDELLVFLVENQRCLPQHIDVALAR
jgi:hypothetical protein